MKANILALTMASCLLAAGVAVAAENDAADIMQRKCSTCHGPKGLSISPTFPHLAGQTAQYLEVQLKAFRDRSRADPHAQAFMWGMAAQLTDATIKQMAVAYSKMPPPQGESAPADEVAAGKAIFDSGIEKQEVPACMACHGEKAEGNEAFPRLAGQRRSYLEKQLEAFAAELRSNDIMHENSKKLTARQISDVAAFLSSR